MANLLPEEGIYRGSLKENEEFSLEVTGVTRTPLGKFSERLITDKNIRDTVAELMAISIPHVEGISSPYLISSGIVVGDDVKGMVVERGYLRGEMQEIRLTATRSSDLAFLEASLRYVRDAKHSDLHGIQSFVDEIQNTQKYQTLCVDNVPWNSRNSKHSRRLAEYLNFNYGDIISGAFGEGLRLYEIHDPYIPPQGENYVFVFDPKTNPSPSKDFKRFYEPKDYVCVKAFEGFSMGPEFLKLLEECVSDKFHL